MDITLPEQGRKTISSRPKLNRKKILPVLGLIFVAAVAWWQITLSSAGTPVKAVTVNRGDIEIYVSAPARVSLPSRADLSFKTAGRIAEIKVRKGDNVIAGQVLATLDMTSIYPQINQAEANLKIAQAGLRKLLSGRSQREIAVAEASVDQAETAVENARRNLKTVKKIIEQGKQKAALNVKNAEIGVNIASQQLNKLKSGARSQEITLADSQLAQASQALADAQANYDRVVALNNALLDEANQAVISAKAVMDKIAETDTSSVTYLNAKSAYDAAVAARNRVNASNNQSLEAAQAQLNSAKKAYDIALAQNNLTKASARSEDLAIAESQLKQAEITLELAKIGLDDASLDAQLDAAQAQLDTAVRSSQVAIAQLELQREGPRAADLQTAKAQIEQAQASLASAKSIADDAVLKAPFSGKVAAVNGRPGEIAGMSAAGGGGALITLINFDRIELSADVDETEVGKIKVGQEARIMLDAYEGRSFKGKLTNISLISSKNSTGGTVFGVTIVVNPGKAEFREGMSGDVDIIVASKKDVLTVPFDAVKTDGRRNTVYVIENDIAIKREVKIGLASDTAYEILSGLKEGDVVAVGKTLLTNGQQVKVSKDRQAKQ